MALTPAKIPNIRQQTYRNPRDARRSFYKWVCKQGLHGKLYIVHHGKWTFHERDSSGYHYGYPWARGYPSWSATHSKCRNQWEREAEVHFDRMREKISEEWKSEYELERQRWIAKDRVASVERLKHSKFFKLLAAAPALKENVA